MTHHYNRFIVRIRFDRFTDDCRPFWGNWVRSGGRSVPKYRSSRVAFSLPHIIPNTSDVVVNISCVMEKVINFTTPFQPFE